MPTATTSEYVVVMPRLVCETNVIEVPVASSAPDKTPYTEKWKSEVESSSKPNEVHKTPNEKKKLNMMSAFLAVVQSTVNDGHNPAEIPAATPTAVTTTGDVITTS
jgi:hypothetical protein